MKYFKSFYDRYTTYFNLGFKNILRVFLYRIFLKLGIHPVQYINSPIVRGPFFNNLKLNNYYFFKNFKKLNFFYIFGWYKINFSKRSPLWLKNPFVKNKKKNKLKHWWNISDFDNGDIKGIWELSRFHWVIHLAISAANGNSSSLKKINFWIDDWCQNNPPFKGPNWKCAQECSIRIINMIIASLILNQDFYTEKNLLKFVKIHLERISKTLSYAIAQQNNHATTEAAALFIGGCFLKDFDKRAKKWENKGRRLLEQHSLNFIMSDGSFSQYSLNYHRFMLDTYSIAEAWRRNKNLKPFSKKLYQQLKLATRWLHVMVDKTSGQAPNIGSNDGAQFLQFPGYDYCDFRPSVQLATSLFLNADAYGKGPWNQYLKLLRIKEKKIKIKTSSKTFDRGGYHVLRMNKAMAILRYPRFKFRPGHSDCLHLDFWHNGHNILRDGGTFSYNSNLTNWYSSTAAHNTIEFDKKNQMPKISRFLFGNWVDSNQIKKVKKINNFIQASASYSDNNNSHDRNIKLYKNELICFDKITGNFKEACIRWRLINKDWKFKDKIFLNGRYSISVEVDGNKITPFKSKTLESLYYLKKKEIPLLYFIVKKPSLIVTKIKF